MNIQEIIKENLPDGTELSDKAINAIAKEIKAQQGKEFVPMEQYSLKTKELGELENEVADLRAKATGADDYKSKYEAEKAAHEATKTDYVTKETTAAKRAAARQALKDLGFHDEDLDAFLLDKVDYDKVELDGDKVKDPKAFEGYKEQYKRYVGDTVTVGAGVATPPKGEGGNNYVAQLEAARKSGNTQESVRIKTEAAKEGVFLI